MEKRYRSPGKGKTPYPTIRESINLINSDVVVVSAGYNMSNERVKNEVEIALQSGIDVIWESKANFLQ